MKQRLVNIELLRIICMIMIVTLHCLSFTGLLSAYKSPDYQSAIIWILEIFSFVAVNVYVLIGAYLMCNKKFSLKRILKLWLQVFFYSILITIIFYLNKENISKFEFITYLLPITFKIYWFPTIYIGLIVFSPFLNKFIKSISKKQYQLLLCLNALLFSILPFAIQQSSHLNFGGCYSIVWFINVYLIAGYIKLFIDLNKIKKKNCLLVYIVSLLLTFSIFMFLIKYPTPYYSPDMFYSYHFILVLIASIAIFLLFLKLNIKNRILSKIILCLSSLTFGVYLIHEHPLMRNFIWSKFTYLVNEFSVINIILVILSIYLICSAIDWIRKIIFIIPNKIINENKYINKLEKKVVKIFEKD